MFSIKERKNERGCVIYVFALLIIVLGAICYFLAKEERKKECFGINDLDEPKLSTTKKKKEAKKERTGDE